MGVAHPDAVGFAVGDELRQPLGTLEGHDAQAGRCDPAIRLDELDVLEHLVGEPAAAGGHLLVHPLDVEAVLQIGEGGVGLHGPLRGMVPGVVVKLGATRGRRPRRVVKRDAPAQTPRQRFHHRRRRVRVEERRVGAGHADAAPHERHEIARYRPLEHRDEALAQGGVLGEGLPRGHAGRQIVERDGVLMPRGFWRQRQRDFDDERRQPAVVQHPFEGSPRHPFAPRRGLDGEDVHRRHVAVLAQQAPLDGADAP